MHIEPVSSTTETNLEQFAPIYAEEYQGYKTDFIKWLLKKGANPFKHEGYAKSTVKTTHYKIERAYRWKWDQEEAFTKDFTPDDAEQFIDRLVKHTPLDDPEVRDYIKAIKWLFKWFSDKGVETIEWDYSKIDLAGFAAERWRS
jgi:hypothetical protein